MLSLLFFFLFLFWVWGVLRVPAAGPHIRLVHCHRLKSVVICLPMRANVFQGHGEYTRSRHTRKRQDDPPPKSRWLETSYFYIPAPSIDPSALVLFSLFSLHSCPTSLLSICPSDPICFPFVFSVCILYLSTHPYPRPHPFTYPASPMPMSFAIFFSIRSFETIRCRITMIFQAS